MPVTIITGFLGSGKTTLFNHILTATHGKKIEIIQNEFGDVGIDDKLMSKNAQLATEQDIVETLNGGICCTVCTDLVEVSARSNRRPSAAAAAAPAAQPGGRAPPPRRPGPQEAGVARGGRRAPPGRDVGIVIETTGMANPAPVAQTFLVEPEVRTFAKIDGVVTLVTRSTSSSTSTSRRSPTARSTRP